MSKPKKNKTKIKKAPVSFTQIEMRGLMAATMLGLCTSGCLTKSARAGARRAVEKIWQAAEADEAGEDSNGK